MRIKNKLLPLALVAGAFLANQAAATPVGLGATTETLFRYVNGQQQEYEAPVVFAKQTMGDLAGNAGQGWYSLSDPGTYLSSTVGVVHTVSTASINNVIYNRYTPFAYVIGDDGALYQNSANQYWYNLGYPMSGLQASFGVGVTTIHNGQWPYAFVVESDGNLWQNYYNGSTYTWYNNKTPAGVGIKFSVGVTHQGDHPYAFVVGTDGNLWQCYWSGSSWVWYNSHTPTGVSIVKPVGATINRSSRPYAFVIGSDGNLWQNYYNGSAWVWYNAQKPAAGIASGAGAIQVGDPNKTGLGNPYAFVIGGDGKLYQNYWNGSSWVWLGTQGPAGTTLTSGAGLAASAEGYIWAYAQGADGYFYQNSWTGAGWSWTRLDLLN